MAKRKPSKYNLHMKREMAKGRSFKQSVASWNAKKSSSKKKSSKKKTTSKSRKKSTTRRRSRPRGQKALFPKLNRMLFKGGPVRQRIGNFLGR